MNIPDFFSFCQTRLENLFQFYLKKDAPAAPLLQEAMAYSIYNGGKRLRPLFVYATGLALDAPLENLDIPACAIEFIHSYSLVHDDLPAMDNSDLRRGQPTCHKKFNEALAILAGDALQPLAFEVISNHPSPLSPAQRLAMMTTLARASGYEGMVAGQTLDIEGISTSDALLHMYQLKTGALFNASIQLGALAAPAPDSSLFSSLKNFGDNIGLAFQIQDDLLDLENENLTGKPQGLDIQNNKPTYPAWFGIKQSQKKIQSLFEEGFQSIDFLGEKAHLLRSLAQHIMQRKK